MEIEERNYYDEPAFIDAKKTVLAFVKKHHRPKSPVTIGALSREFPILRGIIQDVISSLEADGEVYRALITAQITSVIPEKRGGITPDGKRGRDEINRELSRHFVTKTDKSRVRFDF